MYMVVDRYYVRILSSLSVPVQTKVQEFTWILAACQAAPVHDFLTYRGAAGLRLRGQGNELQQDWLILPCNANS